MVTVNNEHDSMSLFTGITRRRWTGFLLIWLAVGLLFTFLYHTARQAVMNEIRAHVMGVAIATAAGISAEDLLEVRTPEDTSKEAFLRVQSHLDRISQSNSDIRYIYTMRRNPGPDASPSDFLYIVDQPASDDNENGVIDPDEITELPGNEYDAADFPEMVESWAAPTADYEITPDPPYPDLISGYAPIRNNRGQTVAIVGVDMIAPTIRQKVWGIKAVNFSVGVVLALLVTLVVQLYYQQREALERNRMLSEELSSRNEMLHAANAELSRHNTQFKQDLKLAEQVQRGFLPTTFPRKDRLAFDKFYLTCDILGGDLFDVFSDQQDHVALYMADVAGHGVSAALISGLLKMAVSTVREKSSIAHGHLHADLIRPEQVLSTLNEMLVKEIPDYEFITVIYAVLDLTRDAMVMASAGHPSPVHFDGATGKAGLWNVPTGMALGLAGKQDYPVVEQRVREGDKVLFYTDGLIEAMNREQEEYGIERVLGVMNQHGHEEPAKIIEALHESVNVHRGAHEVSDDFSLLITEIR